MSGGGNVTLHITAKNEAREIQSAPYWSDHFRHIVIVIGC